MLKETLVDINKMYNLFEMDTVVCYPSADNACCISGKTDDDSVYLFTKNISGGSYDYKEFAFRNWSSIYYAISSVYDTTKGDDGNPKGFNLNITKDSYDYPSILNLKNSRLNITYYVQNYSFLSNQPDLLNNYNRRKFELNELTSGNADDFSEAAVRDLRRITTWLQDKYFRIGRDEQGNFLYVGDPNLSVDCAKIYIDGQGGGENWSDKHYFSIENFNKLFMFMKDNEENFHMKLTPTQIIMSCRNNVTYKTAILRGINM